MRIALLADIHGNYQALQAVLADIERRAVERIIVLGDLVFKGPQPEECVRTIRALDVPTIRGNIDELVATATIQPGFAQHAAHEQALTKEMLWTRTQMSDTSLQYLRDLPFVYEEQLSADVRLRCVHATPQSILNSMLPTATESQLTEMFVANERGEQPQIVAYAHIHLPFMRTFNGQLLFNTGSVGLPFDGDARASYAILEVTRAGASSLELCRVPYDWQTTVRQLEQSDHPFATSVSRAIRAGRKPL